jgi:hypothetical protein
VIADFKSRVHRIEPGSTANFLKESPMHDILVALAFVAMVACPAIVASMPQREIEDDI